MKHIYFILFGLFIFSSCNNQAEKTEVVVAPGEDTLTIQENVQQTKFTPDMVVNKHDMTCGMPVTAGISDTCHLNGKVYGFCSAECKAEFVTKSRKTN
jgi:hypothetical protein